MIDLVSQFAVVLATLLMIGWGAVLARVWWTIGALRRLPSAPHGPDDGPKPKVSAILAARDEAESVEASVRSLLAQEGIDIDVIVIDDGSVDETPAILRRLAAETRSLLVLTADSPPPGWVDKNYALELGQGRARGDFLLFSDADVVHGPRALQNAIAALEKDKLDHLAVQPRMEAGSLVEALVLPLFVLLCQIRFLDPQAARPESARGTGIGAFNLVRADAYRLRGTHARIRGSMLDDRALGRMMREDGGRGSVMRAVAQVRLRPYRSFAELYAGIRKSVLATFGNNGLLAMVMGVVLIVAAVAPVVLLVGGLPWWLSGHTGWVALPAAVAVLLPMLGLLKARTILRFEPLAALLFSVGAIVIGASALHAGWVFLVRGTVEWRGRLYTKRDMQNLG